MKIIISTCKGRETMVAGLEEQIPSAIINYDDFPKEITQQGNFSSTAWYNLQRAWNLAGESACLFLQDDIILTSDFERKVQEAISKYPNMVINFFSMRKKDLEQGTRVENGATFMYALAYYLPEGMSSKIYAASKIFEKETTEKWICADDSYIAIFLKSKKMKYVIHVPSLVEHRVAVSAIDKRRSSKRQSLTFKP